MPAKCALTSCLWEALDTDPEHMAVYILCDHGKRINAERNKLGVTLVASPPGPMLFKSEGTKQTLHPKSYRLAQKQTHYDNSLNKQRKNPHIVLLGTHLAALVWERAAGLICGWPTL